MKRITSTTPLRGATFVALASSAFGLLVACGPGSANNSSSLDQGVDSTGNNLTAIVDPNDGGTASAIRVLEVRWGRLVDVYDAEDDDQNAQTPPIRTLRYRDFLIGENIISDGTNFLLRTSPFTEQTELTILADSDSDDPVPGAGETQKQRFERLLVTATANTGFVKPTGLNASFLPPFPLVPRNAAVSIRFSDLLDADSINSETIRVFTGNPPVNPFDARIIPDPNYGALLTGSGGVSFHPTRVIVDFTVSEAEAQQTLAAVNSVGLAPSVSNVLANVVIRIPTKRDTSVGQFQLLQNLAKHSLDPNNNGPIDANSTRDVLRSFRSGRSDDEPTNQDPNNGFLLDVDAPRILGSQPIQFTTAPARIAVDPAEGDSPNDSVYIVNFDFSTSACALTPKTGHILRMTGTQFSDVFAEVSRLAAPPQSGSATDVRVRLLPVPTGASPAAIRADFETASLGEFQSTFEPGLGVVPECFFSISPLPGLPPTDAISTQPQIAIRFSEPMDPSSVTPHDNFRLDRVASANPPGPSITDTVIGQINFSPDLRQYRYVPVTRLNHSAGSAEEYFMNVVGGARGITDLAGNALSSALPADIRLTIDPAQLEARTGGVVLTFDQIDEDHNGTSLDPDKPIPEVRGQFSYDLGNGVIRPRGVTRESRFADRSMPLYSIMTQTAAPIITPMAPLGSRMMTVWRYADVGFQILDESTANVDVEGINWAPFGGSVSTDFFAQFEMSLAHSTRQPDEFPIPITQGAGGYAMWSGSGLNKTFMNNVLGPDANLKLVYPRDRGYLLTPSAVFTSTSPTGTRMMPYPLNRQNTALEDFEYYTWRDTAILNMAAAAGFGADIKALATVSALPCNDSPFPTVYMAGSVRSLALPLLMEFKCFPDDGAIGLNGLDTSFALATERLPAFRVFSSGGFKANGTAFIKNPDAESTATGGFNGQTGAGTPGDDNTVMIGQLDIVIRVSRVHSIWLASSLSIAGIPDYLDPVLEPRPDDQPNGTSVVLAFRGASVIQIPEPDPLLADPDDRFDARRYDAYGDPLVTRTITGPNCPGAGYAATNTLVVTTANFSPTFFPDPADFTWHSDIQDLDGAEFLQVRMTFVSNAATGLTPELSTLAIPFLK